MSGKRILIFADTMVGGGAERVLLNLLRYVLDPSQADLCFYRLTGALTGELPPEATVFSLYPPEGKRLYERALFRTPLRFAFERRRLRRILRGRSYDTVLSWLEGPASLMHSYVLDTINARHVTWVHTDMRLNRWTLPFFGSAEREAAFYSRIGHIGFVSEQARLAFPYATEAPQSVVHNLIGLERIASLAKATPPLRRSRFTLMYLGRLEPVKRPDRFVDTVAELAARGIDVEGWIVGSGALQAELEQRVQARGIADRVVMTGFLPNPYPLLAQADALMLTSDAEGLPLVVVEALSLGVPVVATRCAGAEELLGGGAGVLTDFSVAALADAAESLINRPDLLAALRDKARRAAEKYSPDRLAETIRDLLFPAAKR